jgi:hypothetical protein
MMGFCVMKDEAVEQANEEDIFSYEVSDEALEAAGDEAMPQTATATWICSGIWCPA